MFRWPINMKVKKIAFFTLGCRLNQFETDSLAGQFLSAGYKIVNFDKEADAYVINTCSVTGKSDRKSRNIINRAKNRKAVTIVTGCFAESSRKELESSGVTFVVGNPQKQNIFKLLDNYFNNIKHDREIGPPGVFDFPASTVFHTRGLVKIQDGCNNFCSFCIIPFLRGRAVSRDPKSVLLGVKESLSQGIKEISLTGVNIGRYHYENVTFSKLVEDIISLPGEFRLRIPSLEPDNLDRRLVELFANPKLGRHLHLCLQSGSDRILGLMRRNYTYTDFLIFTQKIRGEYPLFNFTTDIMTGFPGETDEDFKKTLDSITEINFGHVHTFPYSKRKMTKAAKMPDQIPEKIKKERAELVRETSEIEKQKYREKLIGSEDLVLIEDLKNTARGYGSYYAPIEFKTQSAKANTFRRVIISGLRKPELFLKAELI